MYSLMSIRIIDCSSQQNSANARAVSVLPTPVGQENELQSAAADRSIPRAKRRIAWPQPQRRILAHHALAQRELHVHQLLHFPFQHPRNRNPRPLADDAAMSSSSTSFFNMRAAPVLASCAASKRFNSASSLGSSHTGSAQPAPVALSRLLFASKRQRLNLSLISLMWLSASRSLVQRARLAVICSVSSLPRVPLHRAARGCSCPSRASGPSRSISSDVSGAPIDHLRRHRAS